MTTSIVFLCPTNISLFFFFLLFFLQLYKHVVQIVEKFIKKVRYTVIYVDFCG